MILTNCRVIPELCEGFEEEFVDIRVEGKNIGEILPAGGHYIGEQVIDCTGKTVLPGLFNLHVHLYFNFDYMTDDLSEQSCFLTSFRYMNTLLSYGYTSIRDCGGLYGIAKRLRDEVNRGALIGPDIKACGMILTPHLNGTPKYLQGVGSAYYGHPVNGTDAVRAEARRELAEGADFIKIFGGCPYGAFTRRGGQSVFMPDEMEEFVKIAKFENAYIASHCISEPNCAEAIELGIYSIEHALYLSPKNVDRLIELGSKSVIIPTLSVQYLILGEDAMNDSYGNMRYAYDAGVLLGWGTDAMEDMFFKGPGAEFLARERCMNLPAVEILKQATINSAKINGTDVERGSIKVGKRADFAIVNGDPIDDLSIFNYPCSVVIKDGQIVARDGMVMHTDPSPNK